MADTQWPRYQVFVQVRPGEPHQDAGSVHAPDPEMALLNARDVFVRRPACTSLWLVPAEAITVRSAEQPPEPAAEPAESGKLQPYHIFHKLKPAGGMSEAGLVTAGSVQEALNLAIAHFSGNAGPGEQASVWWAFPAEVVHHSQPDDQDSLFNPAFDKPFRLSTDFKTHTLMREIKSRSNE